MRGRGQKVASGRALTGAGLLGELHPVGGEQPGPLRAVLQLREREERREPLERQLLRARLHLSHRLEELGEHEVEDVRLPGLAGLEGERGPRLLERLARDPGRRERGRLGGEVRAPGLRRSE